VIQMRTRLSVLVSVQPLVSYVLAAVLYCNAAGLTASSLHILLQQSPDDAYHQDAFIRVGDDLSASGSIFLCRNFLGCHRVI